MDGDTPLIENSKAVSNIADLLSTKSELVEKALLFRTVATGRDVIDKQHTEQEATYGRDAFAKVSWNFLSLHLISCNSGKHCFWLKVGSEQPCLWKTFTIELSFITVHFSVLHRAECFGK